MEEDRLKRKRSTSKGKFHRLLRVYNESLQGNESSEVLKDILIDVEKAFSEMDENNTAYMECLDDDLDEERLQELDKDMETMAKELYEAKSKLVRKSEVRKKENIENDIGNQQKQVLKVRKLDLPEFSGNIRDYPSFKREYQTHMVSCYGEDPFALKSCLSGEALATVKGSDDDFEEMFRRLDIKYGRPEKLTDAVLSELKNLRKISDGDHVKFIQMVDVVESCWLDLKRMGLEGEMNTATMVSQIERMLPELQRREWALRKQRLGPGQRFRPFLDFLLEEKFALEYMENDIRGATIDSNSRKGKIHVSVSQDRVHVASSNELQSHLEEQRKTLDQVVQGLALVAEAVSGSKNKQEFAGVGGNQSSRRNRCWYHGTNNHDIKECAAFQSLDINERLECVQQARACFSCLQQGHMSSRCFDRKKCEEANCSRMHHPLLHNHAMNGGSFHSSKSASNQDPVLLMISEVRCINGKKLTVLYDPGANMSLVTHSAAHRLGIKGKEVTLTITKVGNVSETINSREYMIPLQDRDGNIWQIKAFGMEEVTAHVGATDIREVAPLFTGITETDIRRPTGKVDLLIGTDYCSLIPEKVQQIDGLQLVENPFGYCLRGKHQLLKTQSKSCNFVQIHFTKGFVVDSHDHDYIGPATSFQKDLKQFFEVESLGTQCNPKCGGCKCGKCPIGSKEYTIQEEGELLQIETGLVYNSNERSWVAEYPWKKDATKLPNNYIAAKSRLVSTEKRLFKQGEEYANLYHEQIMDMVQRQVAERMSEEEIASYTGPVHYLPHHEVLKSESKTTPLRIVFNSSASFMGHVLNDYWAKGPNVLNDLLAVLLQFRKQPVAVVGDISKMYNAVKLSEIDQQTHRFLWRNLDMKREPDHYILKTVTFGDRPSGTIATVALRKTAELFKEVYPEASQIITNNSYVDDILFSTESIVKAQEIAHQIEAILKSGGFKMKEWIFSGTTEDCMIEADTPGEKVLGMVWEPTRDVFKFKAKLVFTDGSSSTTVTRNTLHESVPQELTRRIVLSQAAKLFDPLGLVLPYNLKAKLLMREVCMKVNEGEAERGTERPHSWDTPIPKDLRRKWLEYFEGIFEVEKLEFQRCLITDMGSENLSLVVFSDGSKLAYGACAYIRWKKADGTYDACLIAAKNRIAPSRQLTIPRLELCGAVLGARLRQKVENDLGLTFDNVFHIVDSMIVRAQIQKHSYGFGTFTATRVAEIQNKTDPSEWWWVPGDQNVADLTTRITLPKELGKGSVWQKGPDFLRQPIESWPISKECTVDVSDLPDLAISVAHCTISAELDGESGHNRMLDDFYPNRYNDLCKLFRVTCIILRIAKRRSFKGAGLEITAKEICEAECCWIMYAQQDLRQDWQVAYKRLGVKKNMEGIIVVGARMANWLKATWNATEFVLLPPKSHLAHLCLMSMHRQDHAGIDLTLAKVRARYWIPGARKALKAIKKECVECRRREKIVMSQQMGALPLERMKPSPPFYNTTVDLFGPFVIRDAVKKRTHGKAYGVIFSCLACRGVYLDVTDSYSTDSFMMVLRRFVSLRGYPRKIRSDIGSQLVAADKEIRELNANWNWQQITNFGVHSGLEWEFCKSADAPWENGCSEALIKSVKKCMSGAVGSSVLTIHELQTVLFEVANILNERPIGMKSIDPNDGSYLCPNDLLLGRATTKAPAVQWTKKECFKLRWKFVQEVVDAFWKKWSRDYFPTLIVRQKWHTERRNLQEGDIVLVQDSNAIRGQWRMAEVTKAEPGNDGKVRDVVLRYKTQNPGVAYDGVADTNIRRSVHRLVLLLPVEER